MPNRAILEEDVLRLVNSSAPFNPVTKDLLDKIHALPTAPTDREEGWISTEDERLLPEFMEDVLIWYRDYWLSAVRTESVPSGWLWSTDIHDYEPSEIKYFMRIKPPKDTPNAR